MVNLQERKDDIVKVLFFVNLAFLIFSIVDGSKMVMIISVINFVFLSGFLIIKKYAHVFEIISQANKLAKGLGGMVEKLNG